MGQYLSIGINHSYTVSERSAKEAGKTLEEAADILKKARAEEDLYDCTIVDERDRERYAIFTLKSAIIEKEILPFTSDFFDLYYGFQDDDRDRILEKLKTVKSYQEMLDATSEPRFYSFRSDVYCEYGWIGIEEPFRKYLKYNHKAISFCMEGKIIMEDYGNIFGLLTELLQEKLSKYKLSKAFDVYITG